MRESSTDGQELCMLFWSLHYRIIFVFWIFYSTVTFIPNLLIITVLTLRWIWRFWQFRVAARNLSLKQSIQLKVWDSECRLGRKIRHTKGESYGDLHGSNRYNDPTGKSLTDKFRYITYGEGNGPVWFTRDPYYNIKPGHFKNTSTILWFYDFVYFDLITNNVHKTFRLTILFTHQILDLDVGQLTSWFKPGLPPNLYKVGYGFYSVFPILGILRKSFWLMGYLPGTRADMLDLKLTDNLIKNYLISICQSNLSSLAATDYRLMLIGTTAGLFVVHELDIYRSGSDFIPAPTDVPELVGLDGLHLSKAEAFALVSNDPRVYKVIKHSSTVKGLERWTLWERVECIHNLW